MRSIARSSSLRTERACIRYGGRWWESAPRRPRAVQPTPCRHRSSRFRPGPTAVAAVRSRPRFRSPSRAGPAQMEGSTVPRAAEFLHSQAHLERRHRDRRQPPRDFDRSPTGCPATRGRVASSPGPCGDLRIHANPCAPGPDRGVGPACRKNGGVQPFDGAPSPPVRQESARQQDRRGWIALRPPSEAADCAPRASLAQAVGPVIVDATQARCPSHPPGSAPFHAAEPGAFRRPDRQVWEALIRFCS